MFTPSRLATAKFACAISRFCCCSRVAIIFRPPGPFGAVRRESIHASHPVAASSRKRKERASAIHHAAGVTNVIRRNVARARQVAEKTSSEGGCSGIRGNPDFPCRCVTNSEQPQEIHSAGVAARFESQIPAGHPLCTPDKAARVFGFRNKTRRLKFSHISSTLCAFPLI